MSILDAFGAVPSNFTVPLMVATVAGSIGVAGCAGAADSAGALLDCSVLSFLLHAANVSSAKSATVPIIADFHPRLLFMISPSLLEFESSAGMLPAIAKDCGPRCELLPVNCV